MSINNFRINSKKIFLTYPGFINNNIIENNLNNIFKKNIFKYKLAFEIGDNNDYEHTHILILLNKKCDIKTQNRLDIITNTKDIIHGDYKSISTNDHFINIYNYLEKENDKVYKIKLGVQFNNINIDDLNNNQYNIYKKIIQSHKSKYTLWNDESLLNSTCIRCTNWVEKMYEYKPNNIKLFEYKELFEHQKIWWELLENQNKREILWIYDKDGGSGKTEFCNWLIDNKDCYFIDGGKYSDIMYGYDNQEYIIFDIPRSVEDFTPYKAMEAFKNGKCFSSKYTSMMKKFGSKKVIVCANFKPELTKLTNNRWNIIEIETDDEIIYNVPKITKMKIKKTKTGFSLIKKIRYACLNTMGTRIKKNRLRLTKGTPLLNSFQLKTYDFN